MKAAVLVEQNKPLEIREVEMPDLGVGQVMVRVDYSGICGKQIDEIEGRQPDKFLPHLLGHEGSGMVIAVGAGVKKVKRNDHVVLHWVKGSGIDSEPPRFGDVSAGWVTTFSNYTIASENRVTKIPDNLPLDMACLLGCAVTTGLGIVFYNANLKPQQSIVVFGAGGVGNNVIQGAKMVNAYPITAIDKYQMKLLRAQEFGATHIDTQLRSIYLKNYDVAVDTTGVKEVREAAFDSLGKNGKLILAGVPYENDKLEIDSYPIHGGRQIIGSHGGGSNPDIDIPKCIDLWKRGLLVLEKQITHRFELDEINEAIEVVKKGDAGRCVIQMKDHFP